MPNNIDIFDSYYLAGVIEEIVPKKSFFRDRYFPTGAGDIFGTNKVLVEYKDGDRRMAPFVVEGAGDTPIDRGGYFVMEFAPPMLAPSRLLTQDDLKRRGFGEAVLSTSTPAERARALQMKDLIELDARIARREEWMCSQVMINNAVDLVEYADNQVVGIPRRLQFYDQATTHAFTPQVQWDAAGGDLMGDVQAMCDLLMERGLPATDLVIGGEVANFIRDNATIQGLLDNRRYELGNIKPQEMYPGVAWMGQLNFGGYILDVWVARETYVADNGLSALYFPTDAAMVTAPSCGRLLYGAVTQIEPDREFHTFTGKRVPKYVVNEDKDVRKLRLAAKPLAAPANMSPFIYAANVT